MYLLILVIDHDVVRLDISVHYSFAVAEIKSLETLVRADSYHTSKPTFKSS
jgi:hypothetical protein